MAEKETALDRQQPIRWPEGVLPVIRKAAKRKNGMSYSAWMRDAGLEKLKREEPELYAEAMKIIEE